LLRRRFEQKAPAKETGVQIGTFSESTPYRLHAVPAPNKGLAGYGMNDATDNLAALVHSRVKTRAPA
jgi:hypothetical protein